ncbi:efflux RND transporter periplasmic adaptor subunit [Pseudomonas lijiangensis]|uniref:HlyD family efflux transporter periplasmic adaptor subunit n=1 Tax=Pseudomonas lijiangensis TaxID=2995658 RepID=A0ABX8HQ34_9PSED|nr:HlyD family efflux transporter periplasmic adaptor subunit [Pseudomonas lijiangensis]MBX8499689.1 HlyD family efflux transporter periplasmic adaptor subunit [Pseudomonas lijiangensis]MBX8505191.1 HlyD family efflux transporter periplasmic adaptor subunit [Pseudomonas lijiangensis]MBX8598592.1 HlyD family efflux transporter periplasmic adaptor subunit [Pseudomonas cichorii]QWU81568.1 HlyD family efflux transporter periplasmic adaptor subunit [Pseudomonas lijiangensis]
MTKYLTRLRTSRVGVRAAVAGVVAAGLLAGLVYGYQSQSESASPDVRWIAVQPQLLESQLGLVGRIEAASRSTMAAPFEGVVQQVAVVEGQRVERGQHLLTLDTAQLDIQLREALAAQLKLQRTVKDMENWAQGEEVARARRALTSAQYGLSDTERKLADTRRLFERGIVARMDVDSLEQQARVQRLDMTASQSELNAVMEKGKGENRQIADMELANAQSRYQALQALHARREIEAPFAGIVLRPQRPEGGVAPLIQQGMRMPQGTPLFELASLEQIRAVARVEEVDLHQLADGMPVQVTGDGFEGITLQGTLSSIAAQGVAPDFGGGTTYEVVISIASLTPAQQVKVRLGMSARLAIVTYRTDNGFAVPPEVLRQDAEGRTFIVYRKDMADAPQRVMVTAGRAMPQGVEVSGLKPGYVELPATAR